MRRRLLAATAALVLALVGGTVLVAYARGADSRAMAGMRLQQVLVVGDQRVAAGTPADRLAALVHTEQLPAKAIVPGSVRDVAALAGRVATVDLQPGEQVLASRFAAPGDLRTPGTVPVPAGKQEVSVQLAPQRAVGGRLAAGDKVGIYVSIKLPDGSGLTHAVLHGVLVTQVQGAPAAPQQGDPAQKGTATAASTSSAVPTQDLIVTLAVTADQAEPIVFGQEHGTLWLSLEPDGADTRGTRVLSNGNVYTEAYQ